MTSLPFSTPILSAARSECCANLISGCADSMNYTTGKAGHERVHDHCVTCGIRTTEARARLDADKTSTYLLDGGRG